MLIQSGNIKDSIAKDALSAKEIFVLSAFVKDSAMTWLNSLTPNKTQACLVLRGRPDDFLAGSSDIQALSNALQMGWQVRIENRLHAKIYLFDDKQLYVGSANLTNNGLILYGIGNLEICYKGEPSTEDIDLIHNVNINSHLINKQTIEEMEAYLHSIKHKQKKSQLHVWPKDIIEIKTDKLYVADFIFDDKFEDNRENQSLFFNSRAYHWLLNILKEKPNHEIYFGELSSILHDALIDDPRPYRSEVKKLVQNLIQEVSQHCREEIQIDRPNHSQRIMLIN